MIGHVANELRHPKFREDRMVTSFSDGALRHVLSGGRAHVPVRLVVQVAFDARY